MSAERSAITHAFCRKLPSLFRTPAPGRKIYWTSGCSIHHGAIRASGITRAYDGQATQKYDKSCDCITDQDTGAVYKADNKTGLFISADGQRLPQGWKVNVGFSNFTRVLTDSRISGHFLSTAIWNFAFAFASVLVGAGDLRERPDGTSSISAWEIPTVRPRLI